MPLDAKDFWIGVAIFIAIPFIIIALNRIRRKFGWYFLIGVIIFYVLGSVLAILGIV